MRLKMIEEVVEKEAVAVEELLENISNSRSIIVYNDDVNTFEWVIESFEEICGHSTIQAEQLAHIIHFRGKANVKEGTLDDLKPLKDGLCDRGLSAVIE